jgi:hypothetical protein
MQASPRPFTKSGNERLSERQTSPVERRMPRLRKRRTTAALSDRARPPAVDPSSDRAADAHYSGRMRKRLLIKQPLMPRSSVTLPLRKRGQGGSRRLPFGLESFAGLSFAAGPWGSGVVAASAETARGKTRIFTCESSKRGSGKTPTRSEFVPRGRLQVQQPMHARARCTPGGPESGKKIQIWKISGEFRRRRGWILRFAIDEMRDGVVKLI